MVKSSLNKMESTHFKWIDVSLGQSSEIKNARKSVPSHLTPEQIKEEWLQMIQTGELTLGEQCHPCTPMYSIIHQMEMEM